MNKIIYFETSYSCHYIATGKRWKIPGTFSIVVQVILLYVICRVESADQANSYCYDEPDCGPLAWGNLCKSGTLQSPINLDRTKVTKVPKSMSLVLSKEYAYVYSQFWIRNNGHSASVSLNSDETSNCLVKANGFLPNGTFFFSSLHFHWGPDDTLGSEHTIHGKAFPLELHLIHKQSSNPKQLAVFGVLFQLSEYDNPALTPIIDNLYLVQNFSQIAQISPGYTLNLTALLPKKVRVFRYQGSLTTPTCDEGVIWTVFDDFPSVSRRQVMAFRSALFQDNGRPLTRNYRPVQAAFTSQRKKIFYMKSIVPAPKIVRVNVG